MTTGICDQYYETAEPDEDGEHDSDAANQTDTQGNAPRETRPEDIGTGRMRASESDGSDAPIGTCPYILVKRMSDDAVVPHAMNPGDAGFDLSAAEDVTLAPGRRSVVDTGIAVCIPRGFAGMVLSRSGLAAEKGIAVLNAPGLIDSGYRDSIQVILINTGDSEFTLKKGDRVAQLVIQSVEDPYLAETNIIPDSERGMNGLGSTGIGAVGD